MKTLTRSMTILLAAAGAASALSLPPCRPAPPIPCAPTVDSFAAVRDALKNGDLESAEAGLRALWGDGGSKSRVKKVNLDETWGGATGKPPEVPKPERPERKDPRDSEVPKSVIPGTSQPA